MYHHDSQSTVASGGVFAASFLTDQQAMSVAEHGAPIALALSFRRLSLSCAHIRYLGAIAPPAGDPLRTRFLLTSIDNGEGH